MRLTLTLAGLILLATAAVGAFVVGTASAAPPTNRTIITDARLSDAIDAICAIEEEMRDLVAALADGRLEDVAFYAARGHSTARTARHAVGVADEDVRHRARRHSRTITQERP